LWETQLIQTLDVGRIWLLFLIMFKNAFISQGCPSIMSAKDGRFDEEDFTQPEFWAVVKEKFWVKRNHANGDGWKFGRNWARKSSEYLLS